MRRIRRLSLVQSVAGMAASARRLTATLVRPVVTTQSAADATGAGTLTAPDYPGLRHLEGKLATNFIRGATYLIAANRWGRAAAFNPIAVALWLRVRSVTCTTATTADVPAATE
jgi:hypothetical protein